VVLVFRVKMPIFVLKLILIPVANVSRNVAMSLVAIIRKMDCIPMEWARAAHVFRPIPQVASRRRPGPNGDTKSRILAAYSSSGAEQGFIQQRPKFAPDGREGVSSTRR
jgi:hypothetical protein